MKKIVLLIIIFIMVKANKAQTYSNDYFGQTPPGDSAIVFAPGIISLENREETGILFSPDGNECYFNTYKPGEEKGFVYYIKRINNSWTQPQKAELLINKNVNVNAFSADGKKLYLTVEGDKIDIGFIERTENGWSDIHLLPYPVNTPSREMGYSHTKDGTVYFDSDRPGGQGSIDIWFKRPYSNVVENMGPAVNTSTEDFIPCISPDGSYIIFSSYRAGYTPQDLFISFKKDSVNWTIPISMNNAGAKINYRGFWQLRPAFSPDGKYLFFCHHSDNKSRTPIDIYWVSTHVTEGLRKKAFGPELNNK